MAPNLITRISIECKSVNKLTITDCIEKKNTDINDINRPNAGMRCGNESNLTFTLKNQHLDKFSASFDFCSSDSTQVLSVLLCVLLCDDIFAN